MDHQLVFAQQITLCLLAIMDAKALEEARKAMIAKRFGGCTTGASTGGEGTARRKKKGSTKAGDDKKLGGVLKKMALTNLNGVEEVNIFKKDGNVIHISTPKIQASIPSNTYVISGSTETKKIEELLPGILSQCGEESMDYLRAYAESSGATKQYAQNVENSIPEEDDDEDMPELVENFEEAAGK